jgi:hypothetical protein
MKTFKFSPRYSDQIKYESNRPLASHDLLPKNRAIVASNEPGALAHTQWMR